MRRVYILGMGATPIGEHWDRSMRSLAVEALQKALGDAGVDRGSVEALYVGNMMSGALQGQEHLGALISTWAGMPGVAAAKVEAACASGGVAVHQGFLAVAAGLYDCVAVVGVEKMTDTATSDTTSALMMAEDRDYVGFTGVTFVGLNAMVYREYMRRFHARQEDIAKFAVHCHKMAVHNPYAQYRSEVSLQQVLSSPLVADPIRLLECSPIGDGAAALILCSEDFLRRNPRDEVIEIAASAVATDVISVHERADLTTMRASRIASEKAYRMARIGPGDVDVLEVHDAFTILAAISLEDLGFAPKGSGWTLIRDEEVAPGGKIPTNTMGGLKARGHPVGGTGVYQVLDVAAQLRGDAGPNQVEGAVIGLTQNLGGVAGTCAVHVLRRVR